MTTAHLQSVDEARFESEVLRSPVPVLVDFTAPWCAPCRALEPVLARLATERAGRLKVCTVDGSLAPDLAARFGIRGYPTVIAFADGRERARSLGLTTRERLLRLVDAE